MGMKKVMVVYEDKYTSEFIREELRAEGFQYEFKLANELGVRELEEYMKLADELWIFGDAQRHIACQFAWEFGVEQWVMA
jgi:hypothetical protein